jgi:hypothetical protein
MEARTLRIFSTEDSPRLRYIAGVILGDLFGLPWELVDDRRKLGKHPVINYSGDNIPGSFRVNPFSLLFEKGLRDHEIIISEWKNLPVFFQTDQGSDLPFDIFSAAFYLLTRYEEYDNKIAGTGGSPDPTLSLAGRHGFLQKPIIELWTREFARALLKKFPNLTFRRNEPRVLVTFDVDRPFAFHGRSLLSSFGEMIKDLATSDGKASDRFRNVVRGEKDPFEVFDYLDKSLARYRTFAAFFLPVGDPSRNDPVPSWKNTEYRDLIKKISENYSTGLYSSYAAAEDGRMVLREKERLEIVSGMKVQANRFHSSRFFPPRAPLNLLAAGISEDYSMGYHDEPGFRAGIARPFFLFDLQGDKQTSLRMIPFQVSDRIISSEGADTRALLDLITTLLNETRNTGGTFVSVWHNSSLTADSGCTECRALFEQLLTIQAQ